MTTGFTSFGLPETLITALDKINFTTPTPIQAQAIPPALEGRDVLGTASTGTGKTAAFALPMMTHLINNPKSVALVMTPTRELAVQVMATIQPLRLMHKELYTATLIGGESINKQFMQLERRPRLIVGTPGRINDHLERKSLWLDRADFLVLDETDRMLDLGFDVQIATIIAKMAKQRQTLMFSATMPKEIVELSKQYLKMPARITVGDVNKPAAKIKSVVIETTDAEKFDVLDEQLKVRTGSIIVFVKTRYGTEKLAKKLRNAGHGADAIHGDLQQRKRDRVIADYRDKKFRILVATDVAARGLDIPHIEHVINHDLPQVPEDYIHRIGRTARAGAEGEALNLITSADFKKWRAIQQLINPEEERNARANRTADRNSPRRASAGNKKPVQPRFNREEGRSPWESKRTARSAEAPARGERKAKRGFGGNPFEHGREVEDAYREVRRESENYRQDSRGEGRSEGRYEGREGGYRGDDRRDNNRRGGEGEFRQNRRPAGRDRDDRFDGRREEGRQDRRPAARGGDFRDDRRPAGRDRDDRFGGRREEGHQDRRPARSGDFRDDRRPARGGDFRDNQRPARSENARDDGRRSFGKKPSGGKTFGGAKTFGGKKGGFSKPSAGGKKRGSWAA